MSTLMARFRKALWRAAAPVRRPIQNKVEKYLNRLATQVINDHLPGVINHLQGNVSQFQGNIAALQGSLSGLEGSISGLQASIGGLQGSINGTAYDSNLVLNSLVREIARLQMQVEILQQYAEEASLARAGLGLAEDESAVPPFGSQRAQVA
jgi:hypothetical protein